MQTIKCVVVGDTKTGKTCMLTTYTYNYYPGENVSEVVANIFSSTIEIREKQARLSLWDTSEQDDYNHLRPHIYPNTDVVLICFSVMNFESFRNVELNWHPLVRRLCPFAKIILAGTKIDLRNEKPAVNMKKVKNINNDKTVTYCDGLAMARKINALQYLECSALTRAGLAEVFDAVVKSAVLAPLKTEHKNSRVKRTWASQAEVSNWRSAKSQKSEED